MTQTDEAIYRVTSHAKRKQIQPPKLKDNNNFADFVLQLAGMRLKFFTTWQWHQKKQTIRGCFKSLGVMH